MPDDRLNQSTTLEPCPFCGGAELTIEGAPDERRMNPDSLESICVYAVFCAGNDGLCGCGPTAESPDAAAVAWNRRHTKRDVRRYRWLKARTQWRTLGNFRSLQIQELRLPDGTREGFAPDMLDSAIDKAMENK